MPGNELRKPEKLSAEEGDSDAKEAIAVGLDGVSSDRRRCPPAVVRR